MRVPCVSRWVSLCVTAAWIGWAPMAHAADESARGALAQDAGMTFDQAIEQVHRNPDRARELFRQAADRYEALANDGVQNPNLEFNLGNTYYRLHDLGRAILHYRRGLRLQPSHTRLRANLAYAREHVQPSLAPPAGNQLLRSILFLHYDTSTTARWWACVAAGVIGWGCLLARLRWQRPVLLTAGAIGAVVGFTLGLSVLWDLQHARARPPAVVVAEGTLRLGRGEGYEPALSQPLGPGVELRILEQRADWVHVELQDGKTGWLRADAVLRINPPET